MASSSDASPLLKQKDAARVVYPVFNQLSRYTIGGAGVLNIATELPELIDSWPDGLKALFPRYARAGRSSSLTGTIQHTNAKYGLQHAGERMVATSSHFVPKGKWYPESYATLEMHWVRTDTWFICWELTGLMWITNNGRANIIT
jgi:hypothetical protein